MNPKNAIDELISYQKTFLEEYEIKVNTNFKNLPELILADELRVKEMVFHILNNAIKFNKEKKGHIDIHVERLEEKTKLGGNHVEIQIFNTGKGMSEQQIKESFELFGNVKVKDDPFVIKSSGIGLGISTSSSLAQKMNGSLKIESEKGKGTTVTMKFESFEVDKSIMELYMRQKEQEMQVKKPKKQKTRNFSNNVDLEMAAETQNKNIKKIINQIDAKNN